MLVGLGHLQPTAARWRSMGTLPSTTRCRPMNPLPLVGSVCRESAKSAMLQAQHGLQAVFQAMQGYGGIHPCQRSLNVLHWYVHALFRKQGQQLPATYHYVRLSGGGRSK